MHVQGRLEEVQTHPVETWERGLLPHWLHDRKAAVVLVGRNGRDIMQQGHHAAGTSCSRVEGDIRVSALGSCEDHGYPNRKKEEIGGEGEAEMADWPADVLGLWFCQSRFSERPPSRVPSSSGPGRGAGPQGVEGRPKGRREVADGESREVMKGGGLSVLGAKRGEGRSGLPQLLFRSRESHQ